MYKGSFKKWLNNYYKIDKKMTEYQTYLWLKAMGWITYDSFQEYILDKIKHINVETFYKNDKAKQDNNSNDR